MADSDQPSAAPAAAGSTTVGQILREARVAKDLTIDQLATELRIEARQLSALEENRFEQIGVPVFIKGYLRQYAQRLGIDQATLMDLYSRQTQLAEIQIKPTKPIKLRDERQITVWVVGALVLLVIVVGLAVWWLNGGGFVFGSLRGAQTAAPQVEPARAPATAAAEPQRAATETPSAKPVTTPAVDEARPEPTPAPTPVAVSPPPARSDGE